MPKTTAIPVRYILSLLLALICFTLTMGQSIGDTQWYSETEHNGVIIQNSYPKGGNYLGPVKEHYNHSYLVFFSRVINKTESPMDLSLYFSGDALPIPDSPYTFVKVFMPQENMTMDKRSLFSYGITELELLDTPTEFQSTIDPNEECLFYVVAFFYQTRADAINDPRGGNRAELVLKGQDLFYHMPPQMDSLPCGSIVFKH